MGTPKQNQYETMMLLSRNTILTTLLLASTAVVETQAQTATGAEPCVETAPKIAACIPDGLCYYQQSCMVSNIQMICNATSSGIPGCAEGSTAEWLNSGNLKPRVIDPDLLSKANEETEVGDVGAPVNAASTTSGGSASATGVASYLFLATAVGGAATLIVGL